jgi:phage-related tail fiber protein
MPGQKISSLAPVSDLQAADQFPLARSGSTYKITGDKFASKTQLDALSATATGSFALKTDITSLSSTVDTKFIPKPTSASAQQVLTYNDSTATWVASAAPMTPVGSVMAFPSTSAPTGWLKMNGSSLIRTDYPELWSFAQASGNLVTDTAWYSTSAIGSFSQGNGSTTFRIPDLRGEFVRAWDDSRGIDSGRGIGVWQIHAVQSHNHYLPTSSGASSNPYLGLSDTSGANSPWINSNVDTTAASGKAVTTYPNPEFAETPNSVGNVGNFSEETRPRNISLLYCIKF